MYALQLVDLRPRIDPQVQTKLTQIKIPNPILEVI
jgi:hypothetical protein